MKGEEFQHQKAFIEWCRWNEGIYPGLRLAHHVPNGGLRSKATAGKMKALGVRPGIPDIMIPVSNGRSNGLAIEFKSAKGRLTPDQIVVHAALRAGGWAVEICRTSVEARIAAQVYFAG